MGSRRRQASPALAPAQAADKTDKRPFEALSPRARAAAERRLAAIAPLMKLPKVTQAVASATARQHGVSVATIYRWLGRLRGGGSRVALAPKPRGRKAGARLDPRVEAAIKIVIESFHLTKARPKKARTIEEVYRYCRKAHLPKPHANTIRNRIRAVDREMLVRRRHGAKAASDKHEPVVGSIPGADHPFDLVQIDHTKLDVILVSEQGRKPIGRPSLTVAIDVYSRVIAGYCISLDDPSALTVGLCLQQAFLPKGPWLLRVGVEGEWPVSGLPAVIHCDNAREFHGMALQDACVEFGIELDYRPVKAPKYGGHIERLIGTINGCLREIPGATFSNVAERGENDPDATACMTLRELERYFTEWVVNVYHRRLHNGIGTSPLARWTKGIEGGDGKLGTGATRAAFDERHLRITFLPLAKRSVQRHGVEWDKIRYHAHALRPLIGAKKGRRTEQFTVRRDPRDISRIYFLDNKLGTYLDVDWVHLGRPSISLWEWKAAQRFAKEHKLPDDTGEQILMARERMLATVEQARQHTRKARRERERRRDHKERLAAAVARPPDEHDAGVAAPAGAKNVVPFKPAAGATAAPSDPATEKRWKIDFKAPVKPEVW